MPPPLPVGADQSLLNGGMVNGVMSRDDPRIQVGPYKYELYGVTNHYGNLSSGHCGLILLYINQSADDHLL